MNCFGNKVRELRKRKGITQEQLASVLGISSQAVSKWEMGVGYPDVGIIPIIAGFFEVSIDILFDYDASQINKKVDDILEEAGRFFLRNFDKAEEAYIKGIESYPGATKLKTELLSLYEFHMRINKRLDLLEKALTIAERLLSETDEQSVVSDVKNSLASIYVMCNRYEDAKKTIHSMQVIWPTQINDKMRSAASILIGQDRLEGTQALKPYLHQDLFICCEEDGDGWFEIGSFENALKSFHESATVIELFRKDSEDTCYSFPIQGTESDYCYVVVGEAACLYKLGRLEECEEALHKAYQIVVNTHSAEELTNNTNCFAAYRESYHKHGLDEYKPCV